MNVLDGNLEAELTKIEADPLFVLVKKHREKRSSKWLPFSRGLAKQDAVDEAEKATAALLEQIVEARK